MRLAAFWGKVCYAPVAITFDTGNHTHSTYNPTKTTNYVANLPITVAIESRLESRKGSTTREWR